MIFFFSRSQSSSPKKPAMTYGRKKPFPETTDGTSPKLEDRIKFFDYERPPSPVAPIFSKR